MADNENNTDPLLGHIKFASIIILLLITLIFLFLNRIYPKDSVDKQTLNEMEQMVAQMHDVSDKMSQSANAFNQKNQQLNIQLNQRGTDRESLYQNMLSQYGDSDASKLRPPSNDIGSEHAPASPNASQPNGDIR